MLEGEEARCPQRGNGTHRRRHRQRLSPKVPPPPHKALGPEDPKASHHRRRSRAAPRLHVQRGVDAPAAHGNRTAPSAATPSERAARCTKDVAPSQPTTPLMSPRPRIPPTPASRCSEQVRPACRRPGEASRAAKASPATMPSHHQPAPPWRSRLDQAGHRRPRRHNRRAALTLCGLWRRPHALSQQSRGRSPAAPHPELADAAADRASRWIRPHQSRPHRLRLFGGEPPTAPLSAAPAK